jgi:hypothetical protein
MERQALEKNAPQELDPASAKKWAAITAPLGYVVDRFTLGLGKGGAKAGQAVVKELAERKGAAIAKGAGVGAVKIGDKLKGYLGNQPLLEFEIK